MTMSLFVGLSVTVVVIALVTIDLIAVIVGMVKGRTTEDTLSTFLIRLGIQRPFIAFAVGYVCGHLFGYMYPASCPEVTSNILAPNFWMVFSALMIVLYVLLWRRK